MNNPDPKDDAQQILDAVKIHPGDIFRHYKGGLYVVVVLSIDEATLTPLVTYRSNLKGTCWTRTLDVFLEMIAQPITTDDGYAAVREVPRFRRVEE